MTREASGWRINLTFAKWRSVALAPKGQPLATRRAGESRVSGKEPHARAGGMRMRTRWANAGRGQGGASAASRPGRLDAFRSRVGSVLPGTPHRCPASGASGPRNTRTRSVVASGCAPQMWRSRHLAERRRLGRVRPDGNRLGSGRWRARNLRDTLARIPGFAPLQESSTHCCTHRRMSCPTGHRAC